mmetsp:Transcript_18783/g.40766  ORF Transcript_18783/g.40766 Transcript_18783/m.40766 type:complete len:114 (+) Transcript_18783:628-969(+)
MTNKCFGRVGDTAIIGAGTYANDATCAVSCTGHGEAFIKAVAAYDVACHIELAGLPLSEAAERVIKERVKGSGGLIAVNAAGEIAAPYNCTGMYRGWLDAAGKETVLLFDEVE